MVKRCAHCPGPGAQRLQRRVEPPACLSVLPAFPHLGLYQLLEMDCRSLDSSLPISPACPGFLFVALSGPTAWKQREKWFQIQKARPEVEVLGAILQPFSAAVSWLGPISSQTCILKCRCPQVIHNTATTFLWEKCWCSEPGKLSLQTAVHSRHSGNVGWLDLKISVCKRQLCTAPLCLQEAGI